VDGDIKVVVRPNKNVDITAAFQRVEQNNVPRTHSTIYAKSFDGTLVGQDQVVVATTVGNQTAPYATSPGGPGRALIAWTDASLAPPDTLVSAIRGRFLRMSVCGDGRVSVDVGEECDDGAAGSRRCSRTCRSSGSRASSPGRRPAWAFASARRPTR
jgi:hypothetical protein